MHFHRVFLSRGVSFSLTITPIRPNGKSTVYQCWLKWVGDASENVLTCIFMIFSSEIYSHLKVFNDIQLNNQIYWRSHLWMIESLMSFINRRSIRLRVFTSSNFLIDLFHNRIKETSFLSYQHRIAPEWKKIFVVNYWECI